MPHSSIVPPPGFDELTTDAKVDYVNSLWEHVFETDNPVSPPWHRELVQTEIEAHRRDPSATEDWQTARADILQRIRQGSR